MSPSFALRGVMLAVVLAGCSSQGSQQDGTGQLVNGAAGNAAAPTQAPPSGGAPVPGGATEASTPSAGAAEPSSPTTGVVTEAPAAQGGAAASDPDDAMSGSAGSDASVGMAGSGAGGSGAAGAPGVLDPGTEDDGNFSIAPPYQAAPELSVAAGVPRGRLEMFTLSSSLSAIYPNDVATGNVFTRNVWVYVPAQYVTATAAPFMVVQDGGSFTNRIPAVLDNLIADGRLPVMIAIFINPGPGDGITSQRGLEYDSVSETYLQFVETEILPLVQSSYDVTLTTDPEGRASLGLSSGGAAAFTMGWFRPDLYRRILTYSGSFVALGADTTYPRGAWEYHEHLIAESELKPLRVFLQAGENDNTVSNVTHDLDPALTAFYGWLEANEDMAAALQAKGYHYRYVFAAGAGHAAGNVITQTLPDDLLWLWRGYPIP